MVEEILNFWFKEIDRSKWWVKDDSFDNLIVHQFSEIHTKANSCEFYMWRQVPRGRLAEIIILDQFSRNMFRDSPRAFASDSLALALSQEAIAVKADLELSNIERVFLYMPFMHSESLAIHEIAEDLFKVNGIEKNLAFEIKHKRIIEKFGRYPHRNHILARISTDEEIEFLKLSKSRF